MSALPSRLPSLPACVYIACRGLGVVQTTLAVKNNEFWLSLRKQASLSEFIKMLPYVGDVLSKLLSGFDITASAGIAIYGGPSGGGVRLDANVAVTMSDWVGGPHLAKHAARGGL